MTIANLVSLYEKGGFIAWAFTKIRAWDAPIKEIERLVPKKGVILDLGSNNGLLANYLALSGTKRFVYGIEPRKKFRRASERGLANTKFINAEILKAKLPKADAIVAFHLLHHIHPPENLRTLFKKFRRSLRSDGKLIIIEIAEKPLSKLFLCYLADAFIVPLVFDGKMFSWQFHFKKTTEWEKIILQNGFRIVRTRTVHKGMPFSHSILVAVK